MDYTPSKAEKRFAPRGIRRGKMLFFDADAAVDVIRICKEEGIPILGIDGVTFGVQDSKEVIYSSTADILDSKAAGDMYDLSLAFLSDPKRRGMYFDIVFGD
jgi:hypothetical protein